MICLQQKLNQNEFIEAEKRSLFCSIKPLGQTVVNSVNKFHAETWSSQRFLSAFHAPLRKTNFSFIQQGIAIWILIFVFSCSQNKKKTLFTQLSPNETNVHFQNNINPNDTFNILDYLYFFNGGGVAIGDINNDGLQDIYFTSNQGSNKLYLNKGNFQFEDITDKAGVQGSGNWKTGVTMADVNGDGLFDIYVCEVGEYKSLHGRNELFINKGTDPNGVIHFSEEARDYGLDVEGFNTQATFFDYDKDGDLDMFLVNHSVHSTDTYVDASQRKIKSDVSGDKLFRCDKKNGKTFFTDATDEAGIYSSAIGYGLNVIVGDFNNDNWEDIYVSNDFHENDYYYINNCKSGFIEMNTSALGHESRFSMGSDAGDINNDGWLDLITLDMLSADEKTLKSSFGDDPLDIYQFKMNKGYHHQYSKNCLQLNRGGGKKFADISLYSGVAATDWSWSPLLADFDNDGIKDLFVSNGILKRPNDLDFLKFISDNDIASQLQSGKSADKLSIEQMPEGKLNNYIFKGTADLKFMDKTTEWGFDAPTFSNGAAYADLDNDGDLDLVINNINEPAGIYANNTNQQATNHYLDIQLKGDNANTFGYDSKVILKNSDGIQYAYATASRGFESASSSIIHFGLGSKTKVDTLQVIWPDDRTETLTNISANQCLVVKQSSAVTNKKLLLSDTTSTTLFQNCTNAFSLSYKHKENDFVDFNQQQLIPHEISTQGPKLAVADINGDGLDDFFVCGAKGQPGKIFQQTKQGKFIITNEALMNADSLCEDVNADFFDADGDADQDLYVVSGGNEYERNNPNLLDRLYINDGKGNFIKSKNIPELYGNKSVAIAADIDKDGDMDLFIGGRVVAGTYGETPTSYLLINNGKGIFSIASDDLAPGLKKVGMVTDAEWTDIDADGWKDLVVVGEWMPVTILKNVNGHFQNQTKKFGLDRCTGLWTSVLNVDLDNDGYEDLLVGNWGENSKLQASDKYPLDLYYGDIDKNGTQDQLLCVEKGNAYYPFLGKEELERVFPALIKKRYLNYKDMAGKTVEEIFGPGLSALKKYSANTLSSMLIKNDQGKFTVNKLPSSLQWSPIFSFAADDFNKDGKTDIIACGNFYGVIPYEGRYDADCGNVLLNKKNRLQPMTNLQSGLMLDGEVRSVKKIRTIHNKQLYVFARNNNSLVFYNCQVK
jgi:enediyne biosynthesis protein E4